MENPDFLKSLPRFVVNIIKRIVREDEMNATIYKRRDYTGMEFVNHVLIDWNVNVITKGIENIPTSGRFMFVANHPVGGIDALAILKLMNQFYPNVISPTNEILELIPNLRPLMVGINVFGKNTKVTAEKLNTMFESDAQIMIFPSGEVSRRKNGIISDPLWQKTFITKAIQYKRDIIPVFISGRNSNFFYNLANLRTFLGIKMYIETMFLPNEMFKQRNSTTTLTIGKVIPWQTFTNEKSHNDWASEVKEIVYKIGNS